MPEVKRRYYALVFLLLLALTAALKPSFEALDWRLFAALDGRRPPWPAEFHLVDVPWDLNPAGIETFRHDLTRALQALAALDTPPRAVVLDLSISALPLGLTADLETALDKLRERGTPVFAGVDLRHPVTGEPDAAYLQRHAKTQVYDRLVGFGHTEYKVVGRAVWYEPCIVLRGGDPGAAPPCEGALAVSVAESLVKRPHERKAGQRPIVVNLQGERAPAEKRWVVDEAAGGTLRHPVSAAGPAASQALRHTVVVVGNLQHDRIGMLGDRPGTEVVALTVADQIVPVAPLRLLTHWSALLAFTAFFSLAGVLCFSTLRRRVPALRLNLSAAWALAVLAMLAALVLVVVGLRHVADLVYPQVSFVALATFYAVSLSAHRAHMRLRARAMQEDVTGGTTGGAVEAYDVFISYSRTPQENAAWVAANLAEPLARRQVDGRPLRVFFDQTSIRVGTSWYFKLAEAIQGSRCFVAVYTDEYFRKDFCRFEMGKAAVRLVRDGQFVVVPIVRGEVKVPAAFEHIQTLPAGDPARMVEQIVAQLPRPSPQD
ncbi:MAG: toll/interleukin-1 receptor domain-containing protein [Piscinibacter sp.]|uniref:toll/interleukin-1 receptor domain-containing protein n=1 Tax=Piscinibacter sp. TaxID=1903157 RepID=UPI002587BA9F|nr:toll/interleukin-1 receptor domain-containing protein [Piscinibacter sp.]MCW5665245.1 toll/interleukin-1 receptor domain-containing protein [Piscinibacter sp.]